MPKARNTVSQGPSTKLDAAKGASGIVGSVDSVTALSALYQGEKTDVASIQGSVMAMMSLAIAYMVGSILFLGSHFELPHSSMIDLLLPLPLWLVATFHSLLTLSAMNHSLSLYIIEDALFMKSELPVRRKWIGTAASDEIMDINKEGAVHRISTLTVYAGTFLLLLGFTVFSLYLANKALESEQNPLREWIVVIVIVAYSLIAALVTASWIEGLLRIKRSRDEYESHRYSEVR